MNLLKKERIGIMELSVFLKDVEEQSFLINSFYLYFGGANTILQTLINEEISI